MDLTMSNAVTVYEIGLRMTHIPFGAPQKLNHAETPYFAFGGYEWNVGIHPQGKLFFQGPETSLCIIGLRIVITQPQSIT